MKKIASYSILLCLLVSCASTKKEIQKVANTILNSSFFKNQFTGLIVLDATNTDTLININGGKYFTPASTTKIFTLFTALQLLPERIPTLKYSKQNDTLFIEGTGDPTTLHPYFKDSTSIFFLKNHNHIALSVNNFKDKKYGSGWAWDDYDYYFQTEKSSLPLYGNIVKLNNNTQPKASPSFFKNKIFHTKNKRNRLLNENVFYFSPSRKDTLQVPFITDSTLTKLLLEDVLQKEITIISKMPEREKTILYGFPSDSVYKYMMLESDNFIAEQLLILASSTLSDTLDATKAQNYMLKNHLKDLKQVPRWVDGSGLSRYNLFTPESMVQVLHKMYTNIPRERLFSFFSVGGASGSLKNWYSGNPEPYIYAKTGSLSNNHSLSGYLVSKSGKTLIFSFMNNHYRQPSSEIKKQMQMILEQIRDKY